MSLMVDIIQNSRFLFHYSYCGYHLCEWIHEGCQGKGVFIVMSLEENKSGLRLRGL